MLAVPQHLLQVQRSDHPVLGGAEFVAAFDDRPEVQAFQAFLSSPEWANEKAKATDTGGWVSANNGLDPENLTTDFDKLGAEIVESVATAHRVHASKALRDYIVALLRRTRDDERTELGASPRAGLMLLRAAKARALVHGRDHALPDDGGVAAELRDTDR